MEHHKTNFFLIYINLEQLYNERKIIVAKSDIIQACMETQGKGNTRQRKRDSNPIDVNDERSFPKRSKKHSGKK